MPETVQERYSIESIEEDKGNGRFEIWEYLMEYTLNKPERIIEGSGVLSSYQILIEDPKTFKNGVANNTFVQVFSVFGEPSGIRIPDNLIKNGKIGLIKAFLAVFILFIPKNISFAYFFSVISVHYIFIVNVKMKMYKRGCCQIGCQRN